MTAEAVEAEFDRQLATLVHHGYPSLANMTEIPFRRLIEPLRDRVHAAMPLIEPTRERVPFIIVIGTSLVPVTKTMPLTSLGGGRGFVSPDTADIDTFEPVESIELSDPRAYVIFDVDRGHETLGVRPNDALRIVVAKGRSPLTAAEGVAFITQFPNSLEKNHCFQLLGSRCGDKRVPGLWISERRPKLGFCWAGNLHTWLGAASCASRS